MKLHYNTVSFPQCPSCRNETLIPSGCITNFEVDFRVNRLIEVLARLQQLDMPAGELLRRKAAELRPEVTKSANATRSFLRQVLGAFNLFFNFTIIIVVQIYKQDYLPISEL